MNDINKNRRQTTIPRGAGAGAGQIKPLRSPSPSNSKKATSNPKQITYGKTKSKKSPKKSPKSPGSPEDATSEEDDDDDDEADESDEFEESSAEEGDSDEEEGKQQETQADVVRADIPVKRIAKREVVRLQAVLVNGNEKLKRYGSGTIQMVQQGHEFVLRILDVNVKSIKECNMVIYLTKNKAKGQMDYIEDKGYPVMMDHVPGGFYNAPIKGMPAYDQLIPFDDSVDFRKFKGVAIVKLKDSRPTTDNPIVYSYGNFMVVKKDPKVHQERLLLQRLKIKEKEKRMEKTTWEAGKSLEDIQKLVRPKYKYFDQDGSGDIDMAEFRDILENLGLFLHEARVLQLFQAVDSDKSGRLEMGSIPLAIYLNDLIPPKRRATPIDVFRMFDVDQSGELDEVEFFESVVSMGIDISDDEAGKIFAKYDQDRSGLVDYDEFKEMWFELCDLDEELAVRGIKHRRGSGWLANPKRKRQQVRAAIEAEEMAAERQFAAAKLQVFSENRRLRIRNDSRNKRKKAKDRRFNLNKKVALVDRQRQKKVQAKEDALEKAREAKRSKLVEERMAKELKARKEKELADAVKERQWKELEEKQSIARRGDDLFDLSHKEFKYIPKDLYKTREAQHKLSFLISLDLSYNRLNRLPNDGLFFWCGALRQLNVNHNQLESMPEEVESLESLQILNADNNQLLELPPEIGRLRSLQVLNLGENCLTTLPPEVEHLKCLSMLVMYHNNLEELPEELFRLERLETLDVSLNALICLPDNVHQCVSLRVLNLSWNKLHKFPASFGRLAQLEVLNAAANELQRLPDTFEKLQKLQILDFSNNHLMEVPQSFVHFSSLLELNLSRNKIQQLPLQIGNLKQLQHLDISHNKVAGLPSSMGYMTQLVHFTARCNLISLLPAELGAMQLLETLDLAHNRIESPIPDPVGAVTSLKDLDLSYNKLSVLPPTFGALRSLVRLQASHNQLTALPLELQMLPALKYLFLNSNLLSSFPEQLCELSELEHLDLSSNVLTSLPAQMGQLSRLTQLDLHHNRLAGLPVSLGSVLPHLETFHIGRNPLNELPAKWCDDWQLSDQYGTLWSGYSDGQVADWIMDNLELDGACRDVWNASSSEFLQGGPDFTLMDFRRVVVMRLGDRWRSRFDTHVRYFFMKCRKEGVDPRFDALTEEEISQRQRLKADRAAYKERELLKAREKQHDNELRVESSYEYTDLQLKEVSENLNRDQRKRRRQAQQQMIDDALKDSDSLLAKQNAACERNSKLQQHLLHIQRSGWAEVFNKERKEQLRQRKLNRRTKDSALLESMLDMSYVRRKQDKK